MSSKGRHSKATKRWGTSPDIVERARRVMGGICLDPCSEARFNEVVKADGYYSLLERGEDGLKLPWSPPEYNTRVLCNPPGGLVRQFWHKALTEAIDMGNQVVWVGFSVEQLCVLADEVGLHPLDFPICFLRQRIKFKRHDGYMGSPSHSNYVCGLRVDPAAFKREFGPFGRVLNCG